MGLIWCRAATQLRFLIKLALERAWRGCLLVMQLCHITVWYFRAINSLSTPPIKAPIVLKTIQEHVPTLRVLDGAAERRTTILRKTELRRPNVEKQAPPPPLTRITRATFVLNLEASTLELFDDRAILRSIVYVQVSTLGPILHSSILSSVVYVWSSTFGRSTLPRAIECLI